MKHVIEISDKIHRPGLLHAVLFSRERQKNIPEDQWRAGLMSTDRRFGACRGLGSGPQTSSNRFRKNAAWPDADVKLLVKTV